MNTYDGKQINVKLPRLTQTQLAELAQATGMTTTQIVVIALDRMHHQIVVQGEQERMIDHYAAQNQHIQSIDILRPPAGDYRRARGAIPWQPGDEPAEASIRRLRDEPNQI
jgi:phage tail tube protein FII